MNNEREFTPEEKINILRENIEFERPISDIAREYSIPEETILEWRQQLLDYGVEIMSAMGDDIDDDIDEDISANKKKTSAQRFVDRGWTRGF